MDRIQLKNIKFSEWNSEETNCFRGDIYFDNKKIGYCMNEGRGGDTYCYPNNIKDKEKFKEMEDYCKSLPDIEYPSILTGHETFSIPSSLDNVVDRIFESWLEQQEDKKLEKNFDKGICYGTKTQYQILQFKVNNKKINLKEMLNNDRGVNVVRHHIEKLVQEGHIVLNTNLPFEV